MAKNAVNQNPETAFLNNSLDWLKTY